MVNKEVNQLEKVKNIISGNKKGDNSITFDSFCSQFSDKQIVSIQEIIEVAPWLLDVSVKFNNAVISYDKYGIVWESGIWVEGYWKCGKWLDGIWLSGFWKFGRWYNGTWLNGHWWNGTWCNGIWEDGNWHGGTWHNGKWLNGLWHDGCWKNGNWRSGKWLGGSWTKGLIDGLVSEYNSITPPYYR